MTEDITLAPSETDLVEDRTDIASESVEEFDPQVEVGIDDVATPIFGHSGAVQPDESSVDDEGSESVSLLYLFVTFFKIGSTAFGGFMALISVVESIIVDRRKLLLHEDMLDGISLASVLPGPVAVNVVAYVGYRLRGGLGALVAAFGVILPSYLLVLGFTVAFLQLGASLDGTGEGLSPVERVLAGVVSAVVAIILHASWKMGRKAVKGVTEILIMLAAAGLLLVSKEFHTTLGIVVGAGLIGWLAFLPKVKREAERKARVANVEAEANNLSGTDLTMEESAETSSIMAPLLSNRSKFQLFLSVAGLTGVFLLFLFPPAIFGEESLVRIFTTFSGMSLMLFGGGYVFIPLIQGIVVDGLGWVDVSQFNTAIAIGQVTPGPILISAAFFGYAAKGGVMGVIASALATVGIFVPPAVVMVNCSHWMESIKKSQAIQAALRGIRPAAVGMVFIAAVKVAQSTQLDHWATYAIFAASGIALLSKRVGLVVLIPATGILGFFLFS